MKRLSNYCLLEKYSFSLVTYFSILVYTHAILNVLLMKTTVLIEDGTIFTYTLTR